MKFLQLLLLSLSAVFLPHSLLAATVDTNEFENYLDYKLNGDEDHLYFDFFISNELEFANEYTTIRDENGRGCEVTCKPIQGHTIVAASGRQLQEIKFTTYVKNLENTSKVACTVIKKCFYKETDKQGKLIKGNFTATDKGEIKNPAIDDTQAPVFLLFKDNKQGGYISYKNTFPYSQAK